MSLNPTAFAGEKTPAKASFLQNTKLKKGTPTRAKTEIDLKPPFDASATTNSSFRAFIHGCSHPGNSFKSTTQGGFVQVHEEEEETKVQTKQENFTVVNPVTDKLILFFDKTNKENPSTFTLINMMGQTVLQVKNTPVNGLEISCPGLPPGIYELKMCDDLGCKSKKVIIINNN